MQLSICGSFAMLQTTQYSQLQLIKCFKLLIWGIIMKAIIKQVEGCSFIGKVDSNHWTSIDTPKESFGSDATAHPMELVLIALGSCSRCDVVSILKKKQVQLIGFKIHIDA